MVEQTVEFLVSEVRRLERTLQNQAKQLTTLIGFTGTLLGALERKALLQPDDVQVLIEIVQQIAPETNNRASQGVLKAIVIAAEESPQMMEAEAGMPILPQLGPLHVSRES